MRTFSGAARVKLWKTILILCLPFASFAQKENTLCSKEKSSGWKLLFDGKTLDGWRGYNNSSTQAWGVENGIIVNKAGKEIEHSDLVTKEKYGDFELLFD